jgi:ATP-binding cassette subfamily G (WHITE) protein 2 (SNQ2)
MQTAFAQQMDLHDETSTVREALEFSALLRQPRHFADKEKLEYVEVVLDALELRTYEHVLVGDDHTGLELEQKKRVTVSPLANVVPNNGLT